MKAIASIDVLEAAAYALVSERCRQSYLHDLRGELQTLHSAIELLIRAAAAPGERSVVAEKAAALARRAVVNQEKSLVDFFAHVTPQQETASIVDIGELVGGVLRFIRGDVAAKAITFRFQGPPEILVSAQAHKFRLLVLGLSTALADELPSGTTVDVQVSRTGSSALIVFAPALPCSTIRTAEEVLRSPAASPYDLLLALAGRWASANGGRLEPTEDARSAAALRIYYPLAPVALASV